MDLTALNSVKEDDLKLKIPFGCMIGGYNNNFHVFNCLIIYLGPSNSGKSQLLYKILDNLELFKPQPKTILYCYGEYNSQVPKLEAKGFHTCSGMPTDELVARMPRPFLWVMDDMLNSVNAKTLTDLFTKKAHHQNFGLIFVTQNIFEPSLRVPRLNSQYIILTRAPNSLLSIRNLGMQLFPHKLKYFMDAYEKSCKKLYGYLLIDLHAGSNSMLKLRTNIFPDEERCVFVPVIN